MAFNKEDLKNWKKVVYFSWAFMVVYMPFMTVQNMISQLQEDTGFGNLGFLLVGMMYLAQMVFSIVSVPL